MFDIETINTKEWYSADNRLDNSNVKLPTECSLFYLSSSVRAPGRRFRILDGNGCVLRDDRRNDLYDGNYSGEN